MTPTREELLAQRAEIDAKLAALDAGPDREARKLVVLRVLGAYHTTRSNLTPVEDHILASSAVQEAFDALPLAPAPLPMGEDEIEALVDEALRAAKRDAVSPNNACVARHAIRETLRRVPAWPGEGELREMARAIAREGFLGASYHVKDAALEMARRLKERMGAGGGA